MNKHELLPRDEGEEQGEGFREHEHVDEEIGEDQPASRETQKRYAPHGFVENVPESIIAKDRLFRREPTDEELAIFIRKNEEIVQEETARIEGTDQRIIELNKLIEETEREAKIFLNAFDQALFKRNLREYRQQKKQRQLEIRLEAARHLFQAQSISRAISPAPAEGTEQSDNVKISPVEEPEEEDKP